MLTIQRKSDASMEDFNKAQPREMYMGKEQNLTCCQYGQSSYVVCLEFSIFIFLAQISAVVKHKT